MFTLDLLSHGSCIDLIFGSSVVLNLSNNKLIRLSIHLRKLVNLKALIVSHNEIKTLEHLNDLVNLNTLGMATTTVVAVTAHRHTH